MTVAWLLLLALLSSATAGAQNDGAAEEVPSAVPSYGDNELIESLRTYDLLDDWIAASPVAPGASLLLVTGNASYQSRRLTFLSSVEAWAAQNEGVRNVLARIDAAQDSSDRLRSIVMQVRDALVLDDRLAFESNTLLEIGDALGRLALLQIPERVPGEADDPLTLAEIQLGDLQKQAETELLALNGVEPAVSRSGISAFAGFEDLMRGLDSSDRLIARGREMVRPARQESERTVATALAQIPNLHAARMLGPSDVNGLSVVTVDAYIRGAERSSCSVDWTLLAGIGKIESNHGRIGGASVSRTGQVSTQILGPLLDGGQSERQALGARIDAGPADSVLAALTAAQRAVQTNFDNSRWGLVTAIPNELTADEAPEDPGNGFAVVVDSDGGRLDGDEQWDRAIGPMQFLPETWSKWATDGNGDGVADPHNLYDAATTAGRFLCHLSATRGSSPATFLLGYNSSTSYVRSVLATAQDLGVASLPDA